MNHQAVNPRLISPLRHHADFDQQQKSRKNKFPNRGPNRLVQFQVLVGNDKQYWLFHPHELEQS